MRELVLCAIHMEIWYHSSVILPPSEQESKCFAFQSYLSVHFLKVYFCFCNSSALAFFSSYFVVDIGQSVFKKKRKKEQNFLCFDHNFECIQNETGAHQNTTLA